MLSKGMHMIYDFYTQLAKSKGDEHELDRLFSSWYQVEEIPLELEKAHDIDRLFIRPDGSQVSVEYKVDYKSDTTGNLAIELVSNDVVGTLGWAYSTKADMLVFYRSGDGEVIAVRTSMLRAMLPSLTAKYHKVYARNKSYRSVCLIIPTWEVKRLAEWSGYI